MAAIISLLVTRPNGTVARSETATLESEIVALLSGLGYDVSITSDVFEEDET